MNLLVFLRILKIFSIRAQVGPETSVGRRSLFLLMSWGRFLAENPGTNILQSVDPPLPGPLPCPGSRLWVAQYQGSVHCPAGWGSGYLQLGQPALGPAGVALPERPNKGLCQQRQILVLVQSLLTRLVVWASQRTLWGGGGWVLFLLEPHQQPALSAGH